MNYDYLFKILLIGDSGVGKSSILSTFNEEDINPNHISTIGVDFKIKNIIIDKKVIKRNIKCEQTLGHLLNFSDSLAGRLLHKNEKLEDLVPNNLVTWFQKLNPVGNAILASWLTYTYNGTLLHLK